MNDLGTREHPEAVPKEFRPLAGHTLIVRVPFAFLRVLGG